MRIASRISDLARIQAYAVGSALERVAPNLAMSYQFRESLGDREQENPLWQMPERGVFTQDFYQDLMQDRCDLVVHSWKDLPVEERAGTEIVCTLPRADMRDVLLLKKSTVAALSQGAPLSILTSAPRRAHNLQSFLPQALPFACAALNFVPVRGNVPTRVRKLFAHPEAQALIVAKAALERLLEAPQAEFQGMQRELRGFLEQCHVMVLPLQFNPTAAAQGALAIEVCSDRVDLKTLLQKIHCPLTFAAVLEERRILKNYGGGCHQKIGVSVWSHPHGTVHSLRGLSPSGEELKRFHLEATETRPSLPERARCWPLDKEEVHFFERKRLSPAQPPATQPLFVSKAQALPETWKLSWDSFVWASGWETWKALAKRGIWVNGSSESLGESADIRLDSLAGRPLAWLKLGHTAGHDSPTMPLLATYELVPQKQTPALQGKQAFFWMSSSAFLRALELSPGIATAQHACGAGNSAHVIAAALAKIPGSQRLSVYLNHEDWLARTT